MAEAAPTATPAVLEQFGYQLEQMLGHSTYGKVYKAVACQQRAQVAIKVISKRKAPEEYLIELLSHHIQVLKGLHHKHLITLYQAIETTAWHYIIMELAPSGNVLQRVQNEGPCPESLAGHWFSQLVLCLAYLHSRAVVHRDLKLENLLLDYQDNVKISIFGLPQRVAPEDANRKSLGASASAEVSTREALSQTFCGSFAYACPRILQAQAYDPFLADTWSAGVILYALLLGRLPFDDTNLQRLLQQIQRPPVFPSWQPLPQDCKDVILRLLCPASQRLSAQELLQTPWVSRFLPLGPLGDLPSATEAPETQSSRCSFPASENL
ncbi:testis-specific serine/threonine-protein kinase 4 [Apteryx mantelli]|uniref:non-specific serine/threonine protein kinase n=1 Tax=Apteryx mantelli TaxID=2696672 RepID=A0A8B7JFD1_9AVES